jgi:FKBP-type peptidyl-prolyl cis-trans isomerase SlyD
MIKKGSQVKLHYTLTVDDRAVDSSRERDEPLSYVHGEGQVVRGLEEELEGMKAGEKRTATIPPEKAYGPRRPNALQKVSRDAFPDPSDLKRGDVISGEAEGRPFHATVAEVGPEEVTLDLNHPLAGKTLQIDVEILEVA